MSDTPVQLPTPEGAESIPAALAATKAQRKVGRKVAAEPFVGAAATFPNATVPDANAPDLPIAAASANPHNEDTTMATTIENVAETATDKTKDMLNGMKDQAKHTLEKGSATVAELNSFTKGNVEALVESGKIAIAGMQTMAQDRAAFVRQQFEEATTAARTLATVKSPTEFVKLQGDYVRQQFDGAVAEMSRSTEAMLKLAGEVVQPISNRFALAAEKIKQAA